MEIQLDMFMVTLEQKLSTTWPVLHEMDYGHFCWATTQGSSCISCKNSINQVCI